MTSFSRRVNYVNCKSLTDGERYHCVRPFGLSLVQIILDCTTLLDPSWIKNFQYPYQSYIGGLTIWKLVMLVTRGAYIWLLYKFWNLK